jgi:hypothetical protein
MEPVTYITKILNKNGGRQQMRKSFTIERKLKEQFDAIKETVEVLNWMEEILGSNFNYQS